MTHSYFESEICYNFLHIHTKRPDACLSFFLSFRKNIGFYLALTWLIELIPTRRSQNELRIIWLSVFLSVTYLFLAFLVSCRFNNRSDKPWNQKLGRNFTTPIPQFSTDGCVIYWCCSIKAQSLQIFSLAQPLNVCRHARSFEADGRPWWSLHRGWNFGGCFRDRSTIQSSVAVKPSPFIAVPNGRIVPARHRHA